MNRPHHKNTSQNCVSGPKTHAIWNYFLRDTEKQMALCKICNVWRVCKSSNYISNLLSHLKVRDEAHNVAYKEYVMKKEKEKEFRRKSFTKDSYGNLLFNFHNFL